MRIRGIDFAVALGAAQFPGGDEAGGYGPNLRHAFAPIIGNQAAGGFGGAEGFSPGPFDREGEQALLNFPPGRRHSAARKLCAESRTVS